MYAACALRETRQAASLREIILEFQLLPHHFHDNRMRFVGRASGVHHVHALRLAGRDGQAGMADASAKSAVFLLEAVVVFFRAPFRASSVVFTIRTPGVPDGARNRIV